MPFSDVYASTYGNTYGNQSFAYADTYSDTYAANYGTAAAFPGATAAIAPGGVWTDITPQIFGPGGGTAVTIGRGRQDEQASASPSTLSATLDNRGGNFTVRNPFGAYYGLLNRNTPIRAAVPSMEPFLRLENDTLSGASCPDAGPLDITGTIDVRLDINLTSYVPCVLASKWSLTSGPVSSGGTLVGSTCNDACYNSPTQIAAATTMNGIVGRPLATNSQKVYFNAGEFPATVIPDHLGLINAKCLIWLCYRPATGGSDSAALMASINAYVAAAVAAGAPIPKVVLFQEPQNAQFHLTPALLKQCYTSYYSAIKALAHSPIVVYDSASHLGEAAVRSWYPGDTLCDEVAQDLYGYTWKHQGVTLTTLQQIANAASPKKPLSLAEYGTALSAVTAAKMSQQDVTDFFNYISAPGTGVFPARDAAGLPNAQCMWFNGLLGHDWNTLNAGDFRIPLMDALYDNLQPSSSGGGPGNQRSWALTLNGDGTLSFWWTPDGTIGSLRKVTSTAPVPLGRVCIRAFGQSLAATMSFYTAPGGNASATGTGTPWTQIGTAVTATGLSIFNSTAPLQLGYSAAFASDQPAYTGPAGQVFQFHLRSFAGNYSSTYLDTYGGSPAGQAVADIGFAAQTPGITTFTDSLGNPWQLTGTAEISGSDYRFHGELSSLPVTWDPSAIAPRAPIQAGGLWRRLSQGQQPPVASAFRRAVLNRTGALTPVAYWPCEDAAGATQFGPAIGPAALTATQTAAQAAADSAFACSLPLPTYNFNIMRGNVQPYTGGVAVVVRFLMHVPASATISDDAVLCRLFTTGSAGEITLRYKTGGLLRFSGFGSGAYLWDTGASASFAVNGELALVSMEVTSTASGALKWQLAVLQAGQSAPVTVNGTVSMAAPGNITALQIDTPNVSLGGTALGHFFVQTAFEPVANFASPLAAWAGETAANRFARLCGENGITSRIYGFPATDVPMGAQSADTLVNLLQTCETTGRGLIFEPRQVLALGYRTVSSLRNQAPAVTLDASLGHLDTLTPTDDDQKIVNDVTATATDGATWRAVLNDGSPMSVSPPPAGAGAYGGTVSANPALDAQLRDIAGWVLHAGTDPGERYPAASADLMGRHLANYLPALQALDIGGFIDIKNPPALIVAPGDIRQLAYGYTEILGSRVWQLAWNLVPEAPFEVGVYADPLRGHMDTDGSVLDAALPGAGAFLADIYTATYPAVYGATATVAAGSPASFAVDITGPSGIPWTTNPADFPFDIIVGGEQMTVTSIPSPGGGNFLTGSNSTFEGGIGNWVPVTNCTIAQSTATAHTGTGSLLITSIAAGVMTCTACAAANILTQGMPVSAGDSVSVSAWLLAGGNSSACSVTVDWYNSAGTFLSTSASAAVNDSVISWVQATATFTAPTGAAFANAGISINAVFGAPSHYADDVSISDLTGAGSTQQVFNVIRGVNGIVTAHQATDPVKLAHPAIVALA